MAVRAQITIVLVEEDAQAGTSGIVWQYDHTQVIPASADDPHETLASAAITIHDQLNLARESLTEQIAATTGMIDAAQQAEPRARPLRHRRP